LEERSDLPIREINTTRALSVIQTAIMRWQTLFLSLTFLFAPSRGGPSLIFHPSEEPRQVERLGLRAVAAKDEGEPEAPDFTLTDLDGHPFQLKSQRGKAVLMEFWASWCGPCRLEMPIVEKLHRRFQHKGLTVVGINDEDPEVAQEFLQDKEFTFPMLVDKDGEVADSYEVDAIPTLVLVDREGKIVHREVGLGSERQLLESLQKIGIDAHEKP
jgi:peroxiredoxin